MHCGVLSVQDGEVTKERQKNQTALLPFAQLKNRFKISVLNLACWDS